jgi:hypothetical protein
MGRRGRLALGEVSMTPNPAVSNDGRPLTVGQQPAGGPDAHRQETALRYGTRAGS